MTLLLGLSAGLLALALSTFAAEISAASSNRARAQLAADAAALAAVAESGPYGRGEHEKQALRFAHANDARLIECLCRPGATAVQVKVVVDGVVADARAIFDPALLAPASGSFDGQGLHPLLEHALDRMLQAARGAVTVGSGHRTTAEQQILWAEALARYGDPEIADDWVARPGTSMHEKGLAIDLDGDVGLAARIVDSLGLPLHQPIGHEPWHFELIH